MMAVGVAMPRAHGQAIIKTAMKATRPKVKPAPVKYQAAKVINAMTITAGTK